jgi:hypothetical protein
MPIENDPIIPELHKAYVVCRWCGDEYVDQFYLEGDWSTCENCCKVNIHTFCSLCNPFYKGNWKDKINV